MTDLVRSVVVEKDRLSRLDNKRRQSGGVYLAGATSSIIQRHRVCGGEIGNLQCLTADRCPETVRDVVDAAVPGLAVEKQPADNALAGCIQIDRRAGTNT